MTTEQMPISYADAGVDIAAGDDAVIEMKQFTNKTHRSGVISGIGGFASLFSVKEACGDMIDPVLVSGTDGVGTKLLVAIEAGRHRSVGQDLVAMCVNDVLTVGAKPLFFLDYFASGKISGSPLLEVVKSIADACEQIGCALVGGETAEMPGMYGANHYDLAGFCVGAVDRHQIIDGKKVCAGDHVIGLASSGLHANGFSLARKIVFDRLGLSIHDHMALGNHKQPVAEALLAPTRLYVKAIHWLIANRAPIHAMAHITGGGIVGNLTRAFPKGLGAVVDCTSWSMPPIFRFIEEHGPVLQSEMEKTFNLGIGYAVVVSAQESQRIVKMLQDQGEEAFVIGEVRHGDGVTMLRPE